MHTCRFPTWKELQDKHSSRRTTTTTTITTTKYGTTNNTSSYDGDNDDDVIYTRNSGAANSSGSRLDYDYIRSALSPRPSLVSTYPTSFSHHYIPKPLTYESTPLPPYSSPTMSSAFDGLRKRESTFDAERYKYRVDRDSSRRKKVIQSGRRGWSGAMILLVGLLFIGIIAFVVAFLYYFELNPNLPLLV
ncbi:hypothetical protein HELRODRAFT_194851 [Helobdella robusta]|uniref:Uncharacterized protein n=1 Tax=Helobdella robusta TaxID=6412 RepID=T1FWH5_HELRO|nr:hypothetical protein HELRODRAFT_194851 [Helobdella robusta]ESO11294.1 hypothetical protein HELRODRAFT_194851 [Helobdella robusta]